MRLDKASSATLIAWMLLATAALAAIVVLVASRGRSALVAVSALAVVPVAIAVVTAWVLDDTSGPVIEGDTQGLRISPVFSTGESIAWIDIEKLSVRAWHYNFFFRVPYMSWLIVTLRDPSPIAPLQWLFPPAWFGRMAIPTRYLAGGRQAALRFVQKAQSGLAEGAIARDRHLAGTDDMMARGEAAIQRALAARGGPISPPPSLHKPPQDAPASAPESTEIALPKPIMLNGVPYQPQRPGGFGRKRS